MIQKPPFRKLQIPDIPPLIQWPPMRVHAAMRKEARMATRFNSYVKFRTSRPVLDALAAKAAREGRTQADVIRGALSRELHRELAEVR